MREKNRLSRSLRLESLETRTVFSVDGFDEAPRSVVLTPQITVKHYHSASVQFTAIWISTFPKREVDFGSPRNGSNPPDLRDFHDDHGLPSPEGEPSSNGAIPRPVAPVAPTQSRPDSIQRPTNGITLEKPNVAIIPPPNPTVDLAAKPTSVTRVNSPTRAAGDIGPTSINQLSNLLNSGTSVLLANKSTPTIAPQPATSPLSSFGTPNLSVLGASNFSMPEALFDFSARAGGELSNRLSLGNLPNDDFKFSQPILRSSDSTLAADLVDRAMVDGGQGTASLDKLLSLLANRHRQSQFRSEPESVGSISRFEAVQKHLQNSEIAEWEAAYDGGGMIALALNRDLTPSDLDELAKSVHRENSAWVASVGIFRALETVSSDTTEPAVQNELADLDSKLGTGTELGGPANSDATTDTADTRFHPAIASSTALVGAVLLSLRRIRKSARLQYTRP